MSRHFISRNNGFLITRNQTSISEFSNKREFISSLKEKIV
jgi:hypothetical protein